jgi:hypothetical protein
MKMYGVLETVELLLRYDSVKEAADGTTSEKSEEIRARLRSASKINIAQIIREVSNQAVLDDPGKWAANLVLSFLVPKGAEVN